MELQLDRIQKIAFSRLISDLIEADFIIDKSEMAFFENIISKNSFNISKSILAEAKKTDLSRAISILKETGTKNIAGIIDTLKEMALSDGSCKPHEAIFIYAIEQALLHDATIYSVPSVTAKIDNMTVFYIENEEGTDIASQIESNHRSISNELLLAGFNFVYIPFIADDYRRMEEDFLKKVIEYMIPSISDEKRDSISRNLRMLTTSRFCRDLLYKKVGIPLLDVKPSLLIKISDSAIINQYGVENVERRDFSNYLRIELGDNILEETQKMVDKYHEMINISYGIDCPPKGNKFIYNTLHRSIFNLIAYSKENKEYNLHFDLTAPHGCVCFEPIDGSGESIPMKLTPQETTLFAMIAKASISGKGLDWREQIPEKEKKEILNEYNKIYGHIGRGKKTTEYKDRILVHHIKNRIRAVPGIANIELFMPIHIKEGSNSYYRINASKTYIIINE
ncbi:MAG: hypothetical protein IKM47_08920 [Bacteroidaceae bacterium]|nr:hypothetical protein [Bacteroidaceae bacterium]